MSDNYINELTLEGVMYQIRTRLGWQDLAKVSDKAYRMYMDGKALSQAEKVDDVDQLLVLANTAEHNLARLRTRLVIKRSEINGIPPSHVAVLIAHIEHYEQEQEAEEKALMDANPIGTPSRESSETPSSEA